MTKFLRSNQLSSCIVQGDLDTLRASEFDANTYLKGEDGHHGRMMSLISGREENLCSGSIDGYNYSDLWRNYIRELKDKLNRHLPDDWRYETPLTLAIWHGYVDIAKHLVERGAKLETTWYSVPSIFTMSVASDQSLLTTPTCTVPEKINADKAYFDREEERKYQDRENERSEVMAWNRGYDWVSVSYYDSYSKSYQMRTEMRPRLPRMVPSSYTKGSFPGAVLELAKQVLNFQEHFKTALAAERQDFERFIEKLGKRYSPGWTPLLMAIFKADAAIVSRLLAAGANVHAESLTKSGNSCWSLGMATESFDPNIDEHVVAYDEIAVRIRPKANQKIDQVLQKAVELRKLRFVQLIFDHLRPNAAALQVAFLTAIRQSDLAIVKEFLVRNFLEISAVFYQTAADVLIDKNNLKDAADVAKQFFFGSSVNYKLNGDVTLLIMTARYPSLNSFSIEWLDKKQKCDLIHASSKDGKTAFSEAAESGNLQLASYFINEHGFSVDQINQHDGQTLLMKAIKSTNVDLIKLFLKLNTLNIDTTDRFRGFPALHHAVETGSAEICQLVAEKQASLRLLNNQKQTSLLLAVSLKRLEVCSFLSLKDSFLVNCPQPDTLITPLMLASQIGWLDGVNLLLERGADKNLLDAEQETAIFKMIKYAPVESAEDLFQQLISGSDVKNLFRNRSRETILDQAIERYNGNRLLEIVKVLLQCNTPINALNERNETPLMTAARHGKGDCTDLLLQLGASDDQLNENGENALMMAMKAHQAVDSVVKIIPSANVGETFRNKAGESLLTMAVKSYDGKSFEQLCTVLIDNGTPIDQLNDLGGTALMAAAMLGKSDVGQVLMQKGIDFNLFSPPDTYVKNGKERGANALMIAAHCGKSEFVLMMLQFLRVHYPMRRIKGTKKALKLAHLRCGNSTFRLKMRSHADPTVKELQSARRCSLM